MEINNFDILKKMSADNYQGFKIFTGDTNLIDIKIGKNGWGFVTIAVDNTTITEMMQKKNLFCGLMVYSVDEFNKTKQEIENNKRQILSGE